MKIHILKTAALTLSPLLAHVPLERDTVARLTPEKQQKLSAKDVDLPAAWSAWVEDIRTRGVLEPVKVVFTKGVPEVVDGRNRLAAAIEAGLTEIPAIQVSENDVPGLVLATLAHRKNTSKGALAYLALTFHPYLTGQGKGRKKEKPTEYAFPSLEALAAFCGVSAATMDKAVSVFQYLADRPSEKAKLEPLLIAGVITLGDAKAGAGGGASTRDRERGSTYATATLTVRTLAGSLSQFDAWEALDKETAKTTFREAFAGLSEGARQLLLDALTVDAGAEEGGAE